MATDFLVMGNEEAQITSVYFVKDYEAERILKKNSGRSTGEYAGPDLSSLDEKV